MKTYKSIFISDTHLGTSEAQADLLNDFLKHNHADNLFLVGDIIDGWKIKQNDWKWKKSHTKVLKRILKISNQGTKVTYLTGNHDEFLRPFINQFALGNVRLCNQAEYRDVDGNLHLITHGDMFDGVSGIAPWVSVLGDKAYDFLLWLNRHFNAIRHRFGLGYWSLSQCLKHKAKGAVNFIFKFEENLTDYCAKRNFDGVICGHIHNAEIKMIDGISYMNSGDWVESCSALVEHLDGRWEIVYWKEKLNEDEEDN